jgi:hypothetical protein
MLFPLPQFRVYHVAFFSYITENRIIAINLLVGTADPFLVAPGIIPGEVSISAGKYCLS